MLFIISLNKDIKQTDVRQGQEKKCNAWRQQYLMREKPAFTERFESFVSLV